MINVTRKDTREGVEHGVCGVLEEQGPWKDNDRLRKLRTEGLQMQKS